MKGYAKGYITEKTKRELKEIVESSDDFYCSGQYHAISKKKVKRPFLIFFTVEKYIYDADKIEKEATANSCHCYFYSDNSMPTISQNPEIYKYRKILSLAEVETFYLDDELQSALNAYLTNTTNKE